VFPETPAWVQVQAFPQPNSPRNSDAPNGRGREQVGLMNSDPQPESVAAGCNTHPFAVKPDPDWIVTFFADSLSHTAGSGKTLPKSRPPERVSGAAVSAHHPTRRVPESQHVPLPVRAAPPRGR